MRQLACSQIAGIKHQVAVGPERARKRGDNRILRRNVTRQQLIAKLYPLSRAVRDPVDRIISVTAR